MKRNKDILSLYLQTVNLINSRAKVPRTYGTPHKIYQSEIHTLEAIINYPEANAGSLAELLSVTNGALTQVVGKLTKKGLVKSYYKSGNKKEVYFVPTEAGLQADKEHRLYDEKLFETRFSFMKDMSTDEQNVILDFFSKVKKGLES